MVARSREQTEQQWHEGHKWMISRTTSDKWTIDYSFSSILLSMQFHIYVIVSGKAASWQLCSTLVADCSCTCNRAPITMTLPEGSPTVASWALIKNYWKKHLMLSKSSAVRCVATLTGKRLPSQFAGKNETISFIRVAAWRSFPQSTASLRLPTWAFILLCTKTLHHGIFQHQGPSIFYLQNWTLPLVVCCSNLSKRVVKKFRSQRNRLKADDANADEKLLCHETKLEAQSLSIVVVLTLHRIRRDPDNCSQSFF